MGDDDNELPAVTPDYALAAQTALPSMVQRFSVPTQQGAPSDQNMSVNPPAALPAAGGSLSVLGQRPNTLGDALDQTYAIQQAQIKQANDTYAAAAARLQASRQQGMSAADLFKLSAAFFTPTRNSSFSGALANVTPVLGDITGAQEAAKRMYPGQLAALQQQQQQDILAAQAGALKTATPILEKQFTAEQDANKPHFVAIAPGGTAVDVNALSKVPIYTPEAAALKAKDPANRNKQFRTTAGEVRTFS